MNAIAKGAGGDSAAASTRGIRLAGWLVVGVCLSLIAIVAWGSWLSRQHQLRDQQMATYNLAQSLSGQVNATIKQADIVLLGIVERVQRDGAGQPALQRLGALLKSQRGELAQLHGLFIYDKQGRWLVTSNGPVPANVNNADREYFVYHRDHADTHAHISPPIRSRSTNEWILPVSRRISGADGGFAGVALATIRLGYFPELYDVIDVGKNGTINLALGDGRIVVRRPFLDAELGSTLANGPFFAEYLKAASAGTATGRSSLDRIERVAGYKRLDDYPMVMFVARDKREILEGWRRESLITLGIVSLLIALLGVQGFRLLRLMRKQVRVEQTLRSTQQHLVGANKALEQLAREDGLTGLVNRREFDLSLQKEFKRAMRDGRSIGLLMIDVDHFKNYNDHYGHQVGDECLRQVGRIIRDAVDRQGDVAARYGGEEFAIVLPSVDLAGAFAVAEKIRCAVRDADLDHAKSPSGKLTISAGASAGVPANQNTAEELLAVADKALYAAKAAGRNTSIVEAFSF